MQIHQHKSLLVAILNKSGNVGKTTIGSCLIAPRLPSFQFMAYIETSNHIPNQLSAEEGGMVFAAHEFGDVESNILAAKANKQSAVIDFGASDFNTTLEMLSQYTLGIQKMDLFVVPCTPDKKEQIDTIDTVVKLVSLGIPPHKIRVVFNRVHMRDKASIQRIFASIFALQHQLKFVAKPEITLFQMEVFKRLVDNETDLRTVLADATDYDQAIESSDNEEAKMELSIQQGLQGLANNAKRTMDGVYVHLMAGV